MHTALRFNLSHVSETTLGVSYIIIPHSCQKNSGNNKQMLILNLQNGQIRRKTVRHIVPLEHIFPLPDVEDQHGRKKMILRVKDNLTFATCTCHLDKKANSSWYDPSTKCFFKRTENVKT